MNKLGVAMLGIAVSACSFASAQEAQETQKAQEAPKTQEVKEDFKSMSTNQYGQEYPMVNSQGIVRGRVVAPGAREVFLQINGVNYPMTNDGQGVWTGQSDALDEGNHYYGLVIDGASVPDPASTFIYGSGY